MANQIPGLQPSRKTPGATYHWKPSPRLRRLGFANLKLGTDWGAAVTLAIAQNESVAATLARPSDHAQPGQRAPIRPRWRNLVTAYRADPAYLELKPKSRAEYDSRIRQLTLWAEDGALILALLDRAMIMDLRNALVADGRKHRTASMLRVLRIVLNFGAAQGWVPVGLASNIDIPEAPARRRIVPIEDVQRLIELARHSLGEGGAANPRMALAILLGFWTFQREADLLAINALAWREMKDMSPFARRILAGPDGRVFGLRLQQNKTGAWVDLPLPHALRVEVEAGFAAQDAPERAHGLLLPVDGQKGRWPDWAFQRAFRALVDRVGLADVQFRDLRRSGMVFFGGLGVEIQFITAMSGHAVLGTKRTILDTYMPGNSRFAAEGMATAWSRWQERQAEQREQEEQG